MKIVFYKFSVLAALLIQFNSNSAQVAWGVGSGVGVAEAEFSTNFVNSTVASGYSTTNWTALTVYETDGTVTPGNAYWVRNLNGISSGGYATGMSSLASPSTANGSALFDSDYMDNNGVQGAFGTGSSPGIHKGELISPRIDLTGNTNQQLAVNFYSYYRRYQIDNYIISISTDDGATWVESVNIQTLQPVAINADVEGFITAVFNTATQGVSNLTQCRIKFTFEGYYYYAFVDDISIEGFSCTNNPPTSSVTTTICYDESVVINGTTYNAANPTGTEVLVGAGSFGCDSTVTVNLTVLPALIGTNNTTICAEESVVINGTTYNASNPTGTEVFTNIGIYGCDSTVTINLTVLPALTGSNTTTICAEESIVINGTTYNASNTSGTEIFANAGAFGCDSTVTVNLTVLPTLTGTNTTTICAEESIVINGTTYNASNTSGTEIFANAGAFGCDSTVTVNLTVLPALTGSNTTTICAEESIVINGTTYNASNTTGTEIFANAGAFGCDSTVTVNLTVLPAVTGTNTTTICAEESIIINGTTYNASNTSGTEIFANAGAFGCDSTVTVNLTITALNTSTSVANETITATLSGATYQWLDCTNGNTPISGATNQSFTAISNGSYAVEVTQNNCTDTSSCVFIGSVSITTLDANAELRIYPNPTNGLLQVTIPTSLIGQSIILSNSIGQILETKIITNTSVAYDLNNVADGIYFIQIKTQNGLISKKIIKN